MRILNKIWDYLSGKKTWIGLGMHTAWFVSNIIFKDLATPTEVITGHTIIGTWTGVGLGHKAIKNKEVINKNINKVKETFKK